MLPRSQHGLLGYRRFWASPLDAEKSPRAGRKCVVQRVLLAPGVAKDYDSEMSSPELAARIQATDSTVQERCHCGTKAKWTCSLRLEGAQIEPTFQHEDLCDQHAEQFAAINHLRFPRTMAPWAHEPKR